MVGPASGETSQQMKPNPKRCPYCKTDTVNMPFRKCTRCGKLFLRGSDEIPAAEPFFMWVIRGPLGTGWYRRESVERIYGIGCA